MEAMSDQTAEIFQAIGRLTESVEGLRRDVGRSDETSYENRKIVHARLDDIVQRVTVMEATSKSLSDSLKNEVIPTVAKVKLWEQRGIGFLAATGMVGTGVGAAIATWVWSYWDSFQKLFRSL